MLILLRLWENTLNGIDIIDTVEFLQRPLRSLNVVLRNFNGPLTPTLPWGTRALAFMTALLDECFSALSHLLYFFSFNINSAHAAHYF